MSFDCLLCSVIKQLEWRMNVLGIERIDYVLMEYFTMQKIGRAMNSQSHITNSRH